MGDRHRAAARRVSALASPVTVGRAALFFADAFEWLTTREPESVHAIVTDPPYGVREYEGAEQAKRRAGKGGVWRIPPTLDGVRRRPLPRFTTMTEQDLLRLGDFFDRFAVLALRAAVPGAHAFIAANPLIVYRVTLAMVSAGWETRGEVIRGVQTLRGGDRPKGHEEEFAGVTVMPRSAFEPWGLYRKPFKGTVAENLRRWGTGGVRREAERPFTDVIPSAVASRAEREIADHPSIKPQAFLRRICYAALPLGTGVIVDPFMGSGSTLAACEALGLGSIGIERDREFFDMAVGAVPKLAALRGKDW